MSTNKNEWSTYNPKATPTGLTTNAGKQAYSTVDYQHFMIILGTGPNSPMKVNWVRIWTKPK